MNTYVESIHDIIMGEPAIGGAGVLADLESLKSTVDKVCSVMFLNINSERSTRLVRCPRGEIDAIILGFLTVMLFVRGCYYCGS